MRNIESIFSLMNNKLIRENNSVLEYLKFKDNKDNPIYYSLINLYKVDSLHICGVIKNNSNGKRCLIDADSIRKLTLLGYIDNVVITNANTIRHHPNKVKLYPNISDYTDVKINTQSSEFDDMVDALANEFKYICVVDDKNIECISWLRLEPFGLIFDLSGNIAALLAKDEFKEYTIELKEFKRMYRFEYNLGHFSPRSTSSNFSRILSYVRLSLDEYNRIKSKIGEYHLRNFKLHKSEEYYTGAVEKITVDLAEELFSLDNLYYAIPNPEQFRSKLDFESSLHHAAYMGSTQFNDTRYTVVGLDGVYTNRAKNLLLKRFNSLKTGEYLNDYKNIADYINSVIGNDKEEEYDWIVSNLRRFASLYNNGEYTDDMMVELGLKVTDTSLIGDIDENEEYVLDKILTEQADNSLVDQTMHTPSLAEALDIFGIYIQLNTENVDNHEKIKLEANNELEASNKVDNSNENMNICIDMVNLTDDASVRVEVRIEDSSTICVYIVVDDENAVRIDASEQSYTSYIRNGVNIEAIKKPIKRTLAILNKKFNDIDTILNALI